MYVNLPRGPWVPAPRVFFRCLGGSLVVVCGSMHGDGEHGTLWPTFDKLELEFTLPDGKMVNSEAEEGYFEDGTPALEIENLSPVTELLQEVIYQRMHGEKHIPEIDNLFTAVYFLHALKFADISDTIHKLIPPESEDKWPS